MIQNTPRIDRRDMIGCALCADAPCTAACGRLDPARLLRGIWFGNEQGMALTLPDENPCLTCDARCERACVRRGEVSIHDLVNRLYYQVRPQAETPLPADESRLQSEICGVRLINPFLLASSVVCSTYDMCARAFDAGWAGVSFKTVCSLDIREASPRYSALTGDGGAIVGFKNIEQLSGHSVAEDMDIFRRLKRDYPDRVIVASIMGRDEREWTELAARCQDSGADLVELNFSCPNMAEGGLGSDIGQVPELCERFTAAARAGCTIPILAKLTPNVASMIPAALAAKRGGADGLTAINTIKSVVGVNMHTYVSGPAVHGHSAVGGYSGGAVRPIALRFVSELASDPALKGLSISGAGGIETWRDALEFILLGSGSVQIATAVMQYGYRIIDDLKAGLSLYLAEKGFRSVPEAVGLALDTLHGSTDTLERASIVYPTFDKSRCIGCGRCALSCSDGGHQAITIGRDRRPKLNGKRCVGGHLCTLVCPQKAVRAGRKRVPAPKARV